MTESSHDDMVEDALVARFLSDHPKQASKRLETLGQTDAATILDAVPPDVAERVWEAMDANAAAEILEYLPVELLNHFAKNGDTGKLAIRLGKLPEDERKALFDRIDESDTEELRAVMRYPFDSAGQLMDTRIIALNGTMKVVDAAELLRKYRRTHDVSELKIVDGDNKLRSIVSIRDFALADPSQTLESLARGVVAVVNPLDPREEVVDKLEQYRLEELPVIDGEGVLLGTIRHAELIGALKATATLDMQTMVGASKDERATSSSWFALRKRMPWLQVNLLTAFMAAAVVGVFESTIAQFTALAVLLPVVAGQSGNAGAQALAVTMRGLALREIRISQWLKVTRKEMNTGFWNGVAIAVTCGIAVFIWSGQIGLVIVIASSMIIAMVMAGIAGAMVPIVLKRLGQDPAVASSIILTTVTDIAGFTSFLGIATMMSGMLK